jgi:hypothetical protein
MAEAAGSVFGPINAESSPTTPFEFTSITSGADESVTQDAEALAHDTKGYLVLEAAAGGGNNLYGLKSFSAVADLYVRWYFNARIFTQPQYDYANIMQLRDAEGEVVCIFRIVQGAASKYGYRIYTNNGATLLIDRGASDVFTLNQMYCIEVHFKTHATTGGVQVYIDGASDATSDFNDDTTAGNCGNSVDASFGCMGGWMLQNDKFYFDDIKADASYIGVYAAGGGATYPARGIARGIGRGVGQGIGR